MHACAHLLQCRVLLGQGVNGRLQLAVVLQACRHAGQATRHMPKGLLQVLFVVLLVLLLVVSLLVVEVRPAQNRGRQSLSRC